MRDGTSADRVPPTWRNQRARCKASKVPTVRLRHKTGFGWLSFDRSGFQLSGAVVPAFNLRRHTVHRRTHGLSLLDSETPLWIYCYIAFVSVVNNCINNWVAIRLMKPSEIRMIWHTPYVIIFEFHHAQRYIKKEMLTNWWVGGWACSEGIFNTCQPVK